MNADPALKAWKEMERDADQLRVTEKPDPVHKVSKIHFYYSAVCFVIN